VGGERKNGIFVSPPTFWGVFWGKSSIFPQKQPPLSCYEIRKCLLTCSGNSKHFISFISFCLAGFVNLERWATSATIARSNCKSDEGDTDQEKELLKGAFFHWKMILDML
jgi:hypothetical protein